MEAKPKNLTENFSGNDKEKHFSCPWHKRKVFYVNGSHQRFICPKNLVHVAVTNQPGKVKFPDSACEKW